MNENTVKTLPVQVYRTNYIGDCTNHGVTSTQDRLYLICDEGWFERPADDSSLLRLGKVHISGLDGKDYYHVKPVNDPRYDDGEHVGPMMGGNFVWSCDSRFPADYPLPVHDRFETAEEYDRLSR
jgi:hypothetical protein